MTEFKNSNYTYNENYSQNIEKLQKNVSDYEKKLINEMNRTVRDVDNSAINEQKIIQNDQKYFQYTDGLNSALLQEICKLGRDLNIEQVQVFKEGYDESSRGRCNFSIYKKNYLRLSVRR